MQFTMLKYFFCVGGMYGAIRSYESSLRCLKLVTRGNVALSFLRNSYIEK